MAHKSVVVDRFFDDLICVLRQVERQRGPFALAMLTPSFPNKRGWDLQVAASWLDTMPSTRQASILLRADVEPRLAPNPGRLEFIRVRNTQSLMVQALVPVFHVEDLGTAYTYTSLEQTMYDLDEVIVLVARPALISESELKLSA